MYSIIVDAHAGYITRGYIIVLLCMPRQGIPSPSIPASALPRLERNVYTRYHIGLLQVGYLDPLGPETKAPKKVLFVYGSVLGFFAGVLTLTCRNRLTC